MMKSASHSADKRKKKISLRLSAMALVLFLAVLLLASAVMIFQTYAQQSTSRLYSSYVTPFPEGGVYRVLVLGDSLGEGLYAGLTNGFRGDKTVAIAHQAKWGYGFARRVYIGRTREMKPMLDKYKPNIVVIAVGARDAKASIREGRRDKHAFASPRWAELYSQRIDEFIGQLKQRNIAVYWIGLPIMKDPQFNENMNTLNEIFREKAHRNSIRFIDTWNGFVDQYSNFSLYGPDLEGQVVRLRDKDGIRFTRAGYDKLAHYVEREIRRDMLAARSERNVPLAGAPDEQQEINRKTTGIMTKLSENADANNQNASAARRLTRKPVAAASSSAAAFGEMIASDRASGLTLLSSVTRANDPSLSGGRHNLPLTLRPYYRVLVKGESLSAKPGRADDFAWRPQKNEARLSN